jgi:hypothetical protein
MCFPVLLMKSLIASLIANTQISALSRKMIFAYVFSVKNLDRIT